LEASYIGNHGLHIWRRNVNWNDIPAGQPCRGPLSVPGVSLGCDGSSHDARFQIAQNFRNPARATNGVDALDSNPLQSANRRIPSLGNITMAQSTGNSHYNGLQLWLNRRFTNRLSYQASYTWSHTISDIPITSFTNSTTDPFNYDLDIGDADLDRRHSFVGNVVYVLPPFKNWGKAANHILGDWQLNAIYSHFGATPVDVLSGANTFGTLGNVNPRPNLVQGVPIYVKAPDKTLWLNPAAFSLPAVGQVGSLGKGAIRGKAINNLDFSINKNWRFKEKYGIQFRVEMFNAFNHTNFVGFNNTLQLDQLQVSRLIINPSPQPPTPVLNPNFGKSQNGGFGTLTNAQAPREIQFGLKFNF
jgi:hypothetical protein